MAPKYRGMTEQQRWQEYARLKREWERKNGWDEAAYDAFIDKIIKELGL